VGLVSAITAGSRLLAERLLEWSDQINELTAPGWTDYSSSFDIIGSTTNPTKGNSVYAADYRRPDGSDLCIARFRVTIGSTWSSGSGNYQWKLPFDPASPVISVGSAHVFDSGTAIRNAVVSPGDTTGYVYIWRNDASTPLGSAGPGTAWATGDIVTVQYAYKV